MARKRLRFDVGLILQFLWRSLVEPEFTVHAAEFLGRRVLPPPGRPAAPAPEVDKQPAAIRPPAPPPAPVKPPPGDAWRVLALLQRDGRLLDFLMEDLSAFTDAQIGAAARDIHDKCRQALLEHGEFKTVVDRKEDETITIPPGFDPGAIRLTGNLQGQPPFTGTVRHPGWKMKETKPPPLPPDSDGIILQPAEVELA
jgi:hypothetical protein